ncbi:retinoid-inducible serine carboxypeptidase [Carcharodon carcharias]|uniref:retinoid-inducible serine carboxypeptidase n=1 Tax=Carcharodon carcharias TaxID=13397 RepID=UPI001B7E4DF7|nr:retinoid-inducible serine carboxypeptidase [Carcharodon carcharias]
MGKLGALLVFGFFAAGDLISNNEKENWGYVPVRKDANMFWWLYYANSPTENFTSLPLIMWLQGGPGGSSCGFGNFMEIGPFDTDLNPRNSSWVKAASLLFVDNPVGAGYSYTTNADAFAKDLTTVVTDMMILLKEFFKMKPEFQNIPFYIFSESYGGKMAAAISLELIKAAQLNEIKCHFAGVALGDSWISPLDSVLSWGPYLYSISLLDDQGLVEVNSYAEEVKAAIEAGNYRKATERWGMTEKIVELNTDGVNFYNIMTKEAELVSPQLTPVMRNYQLVSLYQRHVSPMQRTSLESLMNGPIRKKLKIIPDFVKWGGQSGDVFSNMEGDFMKPVIDIIDKLLLAGVNVTVYNGQLDLIVDTLGQEMWVKKLKWPGLSTFSSLRWKPVYTPSRAKDTAAFYKQYQNFAFYWILKAGHMIPSDQGEMALKLLQMVTGQV